MKQTNKLVVNSRRGDITSLRGHADVSQDRCVPGPKWPSPRINVPQDRCPRTNASHLKHMQTKKEGSGTVGMDGLMDMCVWLEWICARVSVCTVCVCVRARACACTCVCCVCLRVHKIQARENREMREMTTAVTSPLQQYCRQSIGLKLHGALQTKRERERGGERGEEREKS